jgi:hypothetical protein
MKRNLNKAERKVILENKSKTKTPKERKRKKIDELDRAKLHGQEQEKIREWNKMSQWGRLCFARELQIFQSKPPTNSGRRERGRSRL